MLAMMLTVMITGCASSEELSESQASRQSAVVGADALREDINKDGDVGNVQVGGQQSQEASGQQSQSGSAQDAPSQAVTADYDIEAILADLEAGEAALVEKLQAPSISQMDMNLISKEIYEVWDGGLNDIWGKLKAVLPEEEMSALTQEEREWIAYKEARAAEVGAEFEGGSIQPLMINDKLADLTRDRVYELAVYLGEEIGQSITMPTVDFAGLYVDTQGTGEVYSELELVEAEERVYEVTIGLYRLTTLEGTAKVEGDALYFEDETMQVKGEIFMSDEGAVFRATASEFEYISVGDIFSFPEKR